MVIFIWSEKEVEHEPLLHYDYDNNIVKIIHRNKKYNSYYTTTTH